MTAKSSPAHERAIRTLRAWDVRVDEAFFLGGASKDEVLKAFSPHIYFDDQDVHLKTVSRHVPVAQVPHRSDQLALDGPALPTPQHSELPRKNVGKN